MNDRRGGDVDVEHERVCAVRPARRAARQPYTSLHKAAAQCPQFALFTCDCAPKKASALTLFDCDNAG